MTFGYIILYILIFWLGIIAGYYFVRMEQWRAMYFEMEDERDTFRRGYYEATQKHDM